VISPAKSLDEVWSATVDPGAEPLEVEVGVVRDQHRDLDGLADQPGIGHDPPAQLVAGAAGQDAVEQPPAGAVGHIRETGPQGVAHQLLEIAAADGRRILRAARIDLLGIDFHVHHQLVLGDGRKSLGDDIGQDHDQERRGDADGDQAIQAEPGLRAVARPHPGAGGVAGEIEGLWGGQHEISHTVPDSV
jgi:hypothetical protein